MAATGSDGALTPWAKVVTFVELEASLDTGVDNTTGGGFTCGGTPVGAGLGIPPATGLTKVCAGKGKLGRGIEDGREMFVGIGKLGKFGNVVPVASEKYQNNN